MPCLGACGATGGRPCGAILLGIGLGGVCPIGGAPPCAIAPTFPIPV